MILFPVEQQVLETVEAELAVKALPVKGLGEGPAGVDPAESAQALFRLHLPVAAVPVAVGLQGDPHAVEEDEVVGRALGRAAKRQDGVHRLGVLGGPLVGLERPHGPAHDQGEALDPQDLDQEPALTGHVVVQGDERKARPVERLRRVAGRRGEAVAEEVGEDDEVALRVEHPRGRHVALVARVAAGVVARDEDRVIARRVQRPEGLVGQLGVRQHRARLQGDVAQIEDLVVGHGAPAAGSSSAAQKNRRYSSTSHWLM